VAIRTAKDGIVPRSRVAFVTIIPSIPLGMIPAIDWEI